MAETGPAAAGRPWDTGIGKSAVKGPWVVGSALVFIGLSALLLYALWQFWPPSALPGGTPPTESSVRFAWWTITLSRDKDIFIIVAIAGALGAMGHVLRSFFRYVGERGLLWSWMLSYFLTPFVGAILGTLVFILLRAGLITGGGATQTDPFGFAAVAALVGLFSAQASEKLKQVFETILLAPPAGGESVTAPTAIAPVIVAVRPPQGSVGDSVEIEGEGLEDVTKVLFGSVSSDAKFNGDAGVLETTVPNGASTSKLSVRVGNITADSGSTFEVIP
jgi:hypothetical protein